jgi:hypothetical protein
MDMPYFVLALFWDMWLGHAWDTNQRLEWNMLSLMDSHYFTHTQFINARRLSRKGNYY